MTDFKRISKLLSLMLRHRPDEFGLQMDKYGFVPFDEVVQAVQERHEDVDAEDLRKLVETSRQARFEIADQGIRALYAHSFFVEMDGEPMEVPEYLYMGCTAKEVRKFRLEGIKPLDRYYVHLSLSREVAEARSHNLGVPCVVQIAASRAREAGVEFYARGEVVLAREIPAEFVGEVYGPESEEKEAGQAENSAAPTPAVASYGRKPRKATR